MGETNTPPVSPRDQEPNDSDEEIVGNQNEDEDFEVIEVYEEDIENEEGAEGEDGENEAEGEDGMEELDIPDDALLTFKQHTGKFLLMLIDTMQVTTIFSNILIFHRFSVLLFLRTQGK
jgi:hypothetical protein